MGKFFKTAKDSSYASDFMAGVEPTGIYTFENAAKNTKNHILHRTVGNIGGFAGGFTISTLLGAAGAAGLGSVMKKRHPIASTAFIEGAKDMMKVFNPKSYGAIKRLPKSSKFIAKNNEVIKDLDQLNNGAKLTPTRGERIGTKTKKFLDERKAYKKQHGVDPNDDFRQAAGMASALVAGGLGGGLNALSAHTQYDSGKTIGKKLR